MSVKLTREEAEGVLDLLVLDGRDAALAVAHQIKTALSEDAEQDKRVWRIHKGIDQDDVIFGPDIKSPDGEVVVPISVNPQQEEGA